MKNTYPSALENKTTYALSEPKGNAVKDQHRNDSQPTPHLFRNSSWKGAFCFRSPQGKLFPVVSAKGR
jgi:hypothetical protein